MSAKCSAAGRARIAQRGSVGALLGAIGLLVAAVVLGVDEDSEWAVYGALACVVTGLVGLGGGMLHAAAWAPHVSAEGELDGFDRLAVATVLCDHDGAVRYANYATLDLFGFNERHNLKHMSQIMPVFSSAQLASGEDVVEENMGVHTSGAIVEVEMHYSLTPGLGEDAVDDELVMVEMRDIGARKRKEHTVRRELVLHEKAASRRKAALVEARHDKMEAKRKQLMLANIAHELRTPLNGVVGTVDLLEHTPLSDEQAVLVNTLRFASETLLTNINDTLDLSKLDEAKMELVANVFAPDVLVQACISMISKRNVHIVSSVDSSVPSGVIGDDGRIRQILLNLLSNAAKFTESGTIEVMVRVEPYVPGDASYAYPSTPTRAAAERGDEDEWELGSQVTEATAIPRNESTVSIGEQKNYVLVISVRDEGIGMTDAQMERLFTPYQQADASISAKYGGTGLGLVISKGLSELMGGGMSVKSTVGEGSTFTFSVRVAAASDADLVRLASSSPAGVRRGSLGVSSSSSGLSGGGHSLSVLVADDDATNRMLFRTVLRKAEHTVKCVENGMDAWEESKKKRYDIILMDVNMPVMSGIDAAEAIRQTSKNKATHIVFLSGETREALLEPLERVGRASHVQKPVRMKALLRAVEYGTSNVTSPGEVALDDVCA